MVGGISPVLMNQYCGIDPACLTQICLSCNDKLWFIFWWIPFLRYFSVHRNIRVKWLINVNDWLLFHPHPQRHFCISCSEKHLLWLWLSLTYIVSQWLLYPRVLGRYIFVCHFIITAAGGEKVHLSVKAREHWTLQLTCTYSAVHTYYLLAHIRPYTHSLLSCQVSQTKLRKNVEIKQCVAETIVWFDCVSSHCRGR